mmetsp:Transcript_57456/g.166304  ORF Transcript_57456/g.166304 Transcript_57456/m.166304 type:complete len:234 (+) Transcript_57456:438-1139(+)
MSRTLSWRPWVSATRTRTTSPRRRRQRRSRRRRIPLAYSTGSCRMMRSRIFATSTQSPEWRQSPTSLKRCGKRSATSRLPPSSVRSTISSATPAVKLSGNHGYGCFTFSNGSTRKVVLRRRWPQPQLRKQMVCCSICWRSSSVRRRPPGSSSFCWARPRQPRRASMLTPWRLSCCAKKSSKRSRLPRRPSRRRRRRSGICWMSPTPRRQRRRPRRRRRQRPGPKPQAARTSWI